jgi:hypothetical protein
LMFYFQVWRALRGWIFEGLAALIDRLVCRIPTINGFIGN